MEKPNFRERENLSHPRRSRSRSQSPRMEYESIITKQKNKAANYPHRETYTPGRKQTKPKTSNRPSFPLQPKPAFVSPRAKQAKHYVPTLAHTILQSDAEIQDSLNNQIAQPTNRLADTFPSTHKSQYHAEADILRNTFPISRDDSVHSVSPTSSTSPVSSPKLPLSNQNRSPNDQPHSIVWAYREPLSCRRQPESVINVQIARAKLLGQDFHFLGHSDEENSFSKAANSEHSAFRFKPLWPGCMFRNQCPPQLASINTTRSILDNFLQSDSVYRKNFREICKLESNSMVLAESCKFREAAEALEKALDLRIMMLPQVPVGGVEFSFLDAELSSRTDNLVSTCCSFAARILSHRTTKFSSALVLLRKAESLTASSSTLHSITCAESHAVVHRGTSIVFTASFPRRLLLRAATFRLQAFYFFRKKKFQHALYLANRCFKIEQDIQQADDEGGTHLLLSMLYWNTQEIEKATFHAQQSLKHYIEEQNASESKQNMPNQRKYGFIETQLDFSHVSDYTESSDSNPANQESGNAIRVITGKLLESESNDSSSMALCVAVAAHMAAVCFEGCKCYGRSLLMHEFALNSIHRFVYSTSRLFLRLEASFAHALQEFLSRRSNLFTSYSKTWNNVLSDIHDIDTNQTLQSQVSFEDIGLSASVLTRMFTALEYTRYNTLSKKLENADHFSADLYRIPSAPYQSHDLAKPIYGRKFLQSPQPPQSPQSPQSPRLVESVDSPKREAKVKSRFKFTSLNESQLAQEMNLPYGTDAFIDFALHSSIIHSNIQRPISDTPNSFYSYLSTITPEKHLNDRFECNYNRLSVEASEARDIASKNESKEIIPQVNQTWQLNRIHSESSLHFRSKFSFFISFLFLLFYF